MNAIGFGARFSPEQQIGWRPALERLARDRDAAVAAGRADPWAIAEAECWLELIDAELSACPREEEVLAELGRWRNELTQIITDLRGVEGESASAPNPSNHTRPAVPGRVSSGTAFPGPDIVAVPPSPGVSAFH